MNSIIEKEKLSEELTSLLESINPDLLERYQGCQIMGKQSQNNSKTRRKRNYSVAYGPQVSTTAGSFTKTASLSSIRRSDSNQSLKSKKDDNWSACSIQTLGNWRSFD